jgi:hypothetical protein
MVNSEERLFSEKTLIINVLNHASSLFSRMGEREKVKKMGLCLSQNGKLLELLGTYIYTLRYVSPQVTEAGQC